MGDTSAKILAAVQAAEGFAKSDILISQVDSMEQAVRTAAASAKPGDVVALSPACASFDKFKNFEERGNCFKAVVNALS